MPYITVSQHDGGLPAMCEWTLADFPNILVLSAGGYGHVPIPLLLRTASLNNHRPLAARQYLVSYVGTVAHGPGAIRFRLQDLVTDLSRSEGFNATFAQGPAWREIMAESVLSLVPRGSGRTAYHLGMGRPPAFPSRAVPREMGVGAGPGRGQCGGRGGGGGGCVLRKRRRRLHTRRLTSSRYRLACKRRDPDRCRVPRKAVGWLTPAPSQFKWGRWYVRGAVRSSLPNDPGFVLRGGHARRGSSRSFFGEGSAAAKPVVPRAMQGGGGGSGRGTWETGRMGMGKGWLGVGPVRFQATEGPNRTGIDSSL